MKPFVVALCSVLMLGTLTSANASTSAASQAALTPAQEHAIEAAARKELRAFGGKQPIPGVYIALYMPGKAPYLKSIGYSDLEKKTPFQPADHFRVGSNTKTFVVTVLLQLQDEQRLKIDDPISKFNIGVRVPNGNHITIRQLAEMRSGLFEAYNTPQMNALKVTAQTKIAPQELVRWAVAQKPLFAPGARWNYSNTNYIILGLIIQAVTHDSVSNEISKRILQPLQLASTSFPDTIAMPSPYARGYGRDAKGAWEDVSETIPPSIAWSAGAMISTVPDMSRWVKSYVRGTTNSAASQRDRLKCLPIAPGSKLAFGMGIGCSSGWYGYTGGLPGYNTAAYYLPSKDITLIAFVTAQEEKPFPGVANFIGREISRIITPGNVMFESAPSVEPH
ncbi:MAG: beta-lactamase family protein [Candidatus Eremiobacteraeota bacterium]|nr:beta-lactamase family protein [Candidatus Eremiobacteraeota bacterium]